MQNHILIDKSELRQREMRYLRLIEQWSLQQIALKFNITRERVRQIIGNTGGGRYPRVNHSDIVAHKDAK